MKRTLSIALVLALVISLAFIPENAYADGELTARAKDGQETLYLDPGGSIDLEVEASGGSGKISYKWFRVNEDGSFESLTNLLHLLKPYIYSVQNVTQSNVKYVCQVSTGSLLSGDAEFVQVDFTICIDNELKVRAASEKTVFTVSPGDSVNMEVTASCRDGEVSYQWYETNGKEGYELEKTPIEGAVSKEFNIAQAEKTMHYLCEARDIYGNKEEIPFKVVVDNKLTIAAAGNRNPQATPGDELTFMVRAASLDGIYSLQWYGPVWDDDFGSFVDGPLDGETSDSLTIVVDSNYSYTCVAADSYGNTCEVIFSPRIDESKIARQAFGEVVYTDAGAPAQLVVVSDVEDPENLTYGWKKEWEEIPDADGPVLSIDQVNEALLYSCDVGYKGLSINLNFRVCVDSGFVPTIDNNDIFARTGDDVTFTVDPGRYDGEVTYRWYTANEDLDCTANSLTLRNVTMDDAMWYECAASDEYNNSYTFNFNLSVDHEFALEAAGETDVTVPYGESVTLAVEPIDLPGVTYSWEDSNGPIIGADGTELTISSVERYGWYRCNAETEYASTGAEFRVFVENGFYADDGWVEETAKLGNAEPIKLTMDAGSDSGVDYCWDCFGTDYFIDLSQETGNSITIDEIEGNYNIQCTASDKFGNNAMREWFISIDNDIKIDPIEDIYIKSGERAEIPFSASCDKGSIKRSFACEYGMELPMIGADGNIFTTGRITNDLLVTAAARDEYGNLAECTFTIHVVPEDGFMKGDVNGDNEISADDLTLLSRFVAGIEPIPSDAVKAACDVTGEGEVTADDLTKLSRKVAGIIQTLD